MRLTLIGMTVFPAYCVCIFAGRQQDKEKTVCVQICQELKWHLGTNDLGGMWWCLNLQTRLNRVQMFIKYLRNVDLGNQASLVVCNHLNQLSSRTKSTKTAPKSLHLPGGSVCKTSPTNLIRCFTPWGVLKKCTHTGCKYLSHTLIGTHTHSTEPVFFLCI